MFLWDAADSREAGKGRVTGRRNENYFRNDSFLALMEVDAMVQACRCLQMLADACKRIEAGGWIWEICPPVFWRLFWDAS
jgi:hypothetical protein